MQVCERIKWTFSSNRHGKSEFLCFSVSKSNTCQLCNKSFARRFNLERHIENVHEEEQESDSDVNEENGLENEVELVNAEDDGKTTDEDDSPCSDIADIEDNLSFQDFLMVV